MIVSAHNCLGTTFVLFSFCKFCQIEICGRYCYEKTRITLPKVALRSAEMGRNCGLLLIKMDRLSLSKVIQENEQLFADAGIPLADIAKAPFKLPSTSALASPLAKFLAANPPPVGAE